MISQRHRPVAYALLAGVVVWVLAWAGYSLARNSKVTGEKVRSYLRDTDLAKLKGDARAKALRKLAEKLNSLPPEERRTTRMDAEWNKWFLEMTETEKSEFLDATLPTGFKQMLSAFEELPPDKRQRAVNDAVKRLKEAQNDPSLRGQNGPPPGMNEDMQKKVTSIGLNAFYTQSSAQTKAELAPLLEEIQRSMEKGRFIR